MKVGGGEEVLCKNGFMGNSSSDFQFNKSQFDLVDEQTYAPKRVVSSVEWFRCANNLPIKHCVEGIFIMMHHLYVCLNEFHISFIYTTHHFQLSFNFNLSSYELYFCEWMCEWMPVSLLYVCVCYAVLFTFVCLTCCNIHNKTSIWFVLEYIGHLNECHFNSTRENDNNNSKSKYSKSTLLELYETPYR